MTTTNQSQLLLALISAAQRILNGDAPKGLTSDDLLDLSIILKKHGETGLAQLLISIADDYQSKQEAWTNKCDQLWAAHLETTKIERRPLRHIKTPAGQDIGWN
jgi:hypothetical protein